MAIIEAHDSKSKLLTGTVSGFVYRSARLLVLQLIFIDSEECLIP